MNLKNTRWHLVSTILIAASASGAAVKMHDPAAHASGQKTTDAKTVTDVSLDSGGGKLSFSASLAGPVFIKIAGQTAVVTGDVLTLAIDTDNNAKTGPDAHFVNGVDGVESQIELALCANEKARGGTTKSHCINGFWGDNLAGASVDAKLAGHAGSSKASIASMSIPEPGKGFSLKIPYAAAGLAAGKTVRVYVLGWKGGSFGLLFKPVTMKLQ